MCQSESVARERPAMFADILVCRFGPAKVGLVSTGLVLLGHTIVCWRERAGGSIDVGGMVRPRALPFFLGFEELTCVTMQVLGLLLAGGGGSPLSVVQESIILRSSEGSSVGKTLALGLLLGKTVSLQSRRCLSVPSDASWTPTGFLCLFRGRTSSLLC